MAGLCFPANAFDFGVEVGDFLFEPRDFTGVIGLFSSGLKELLEALDLVFGDFDLFLLFLVESHLSGNPP